MTVVAPYILTQGRIEPYCSLTEFKFSATAAAIDYTNLVPNGNPNAQDRALYELIVRASAKIDAYCLGQLGTLNATANTENGRYRINRDGTFRIHPRFTPVIAVSAFSWAPIMGNANQITVSENNVWIEDQDIIVQAVGAANVNAVAGMQALTFITQPANGLNYCEWTYVNGWANTFTTAAIGAGDDSCVVTDPTGIYPNMQLTLWDGMNDEMNYVSSDYVAGASTVTFANEFAYDHGKGCNLSAMNPSIKQACIHFTVAMVVERGQGGFILNETGAETLVAPQSKMLQEHEMAGYDLLDEFKSVGGRQ